MSDTWRQARAAPVRADMAVDAGLRSFMLGVYNKMALGLIWSGVLAYIVGSVAPVTALVLSPPLLYVVQWGPVALLLGSNFFMRNPSPTGSSLLYWSVVTLIGAGLGVWAFLALRGVGAQTLSGTLNVTFTGITQAFLITAVAFGGLSLWGYTTKKNLTGVGSFLVMATWGLAAIVLVNGFFLKSGALQIGLQIASLGIFGLLIAFQTQSLKNMYYQLEGDRRGMAVMTNFGALNLYIAVVQIFQVLLSLFSSRE